MAINPMDAQGGGIGGAMPTAGGAMPQGTPQEGPAFEQTGRGTVSKDLLDALVAAKLLREKKMAQNQLMLSMKNDPQTVAEKNETELQGLTQQEITKGVSGVLQNKQRKEQKNLQLAAKGQGQPRRGGSPQGRGQGLANIRMAQAAAQGGPRRMAQGGIVGFQEGQEVEGEGSGGADNWFKASANWVKENPLEAASMGLMFVPAVGWVGSLGLKAGIAAAKFAPKLLPAATKAGQFAQKAFTKQVPYKPKPGQTVYQSPKTGKMETLDPTKRTAKGLEGLPTTKEFSPMKTSFTSGAGLGIANLLGGGEEEKLTGEIGGKDDTKGTTPAATPPAVAQPTTDSTLPTYDEKMMKIERALSQGGIGSFGKNMQAMDDAEAERAIESRKNELLAEYNSQVVDQRTLNQAQTQLLKYSAQLQALVGQDPSVLAAQRRLEAALDDEDESAIAAAQKEISNAQTLATAAIGKTPSGIALISQIAALRETLSKYQGGSATVDSSGFGELKVKG